MATGRKLPKLLPAQPSPGDAAPRRYVIDKLPTGWLVTVSGGQGRYHDARHAFADFDAVLSWLRTQPLPDEGGEPA